jgi:hypothetical protein
LQFLDLFVCGYVAVCEACDWVSVFGGVACDGAGFGGFWWFCRVLVKIWKGKARRTFEFRKRPIEENLSLDVFFLDGVFVEIRQD